MVSVSALSRSGELAAKANDRSFPLRTVVHTTAPLR
jgi:hypothetical protein